MENYFETFRLNIKYYRDLRGMNQSELAVQADSSNGNIGNIESGTSKPSFDLILKIAEALRIHPADLFLRGASVSRDEMRKIIGKRLYRELDKILQTCFD